MMNSVLDGINLEGWSATVVGLVGLCVIAWVAFFIIRSYIIRLLRKITKGWENVWAEILFDGVLLSKVSWIVPVLIVHFGIAGIPNIEESVYLIIQRILLASLILIILQAISRVLTKANEIYVRYPMSRNRPIKGYIQVALIVIYILGIVLMASIIIDRSPLILLSGIGAMTAILMLIFRDTLLSLVAGVQLTTNNLIQVGDWIEMDQFNADGDVIDIALHTVMVQNWDKTITVIPTHKFLEHAFKNWRGMSESGGRRIKRSVFVDLNTIRFLSEDEIDRFQGFRLLKDYIQQKRKELEAHNLKVSTSPELSKVNRRSLTNVGTFRAYLMNYLREHPKIHKDMTFLVRQLQPGPQGLPIEIYVFSNDIAWANYEGIQADIFDHVVAVAPEFDLRLYQNPTGYDLASLGSALRHSTT